MKDITAVLQENSFKVRELLRQNHVIGGLDMPTIEKAYNQHGEPFMLKLLEIITPDNSSFSALIQPLPGKVSLSTPLATQTLAAMKTATVPEPVEGKVWTFWEKLLSGIGKTGEAIGQFKTDVTGAATETITPEQAAQTASNAKTLYIVAAIAAALVILILILKR